MFKTIRADLHIHTCLSPCGDLKMSPRNIVKKVLENNIDVIAISDHNSAENAEAVIKAAAGSSLTVLPGLEICSAEEIHVLALFDNLESASELQWTVYKYLRGKNNPDIFGMQVLASELDEVAGFNERLLIGAIELPIEAIIDSIHGLQGLAIASHVDRQSYSVISQLGFIPESAEFDALEVSTLLNLTQARERFPECGSHPLVQNSDAHFLDDIGKGMTKFLIKGVSLEEIKKALDNKDGRKIIEA